MGHSLTEPWTYLHYSFVSPALKSGHLLSAVGVCDFNREILEDQMQHRTVIYLASCSGFAPVLAGVVVGGGW